MKKLIIAGITAAVIAVPVTFNAMTKADAETKQAVNDQKQPVDKELSPKQLVERYLTAAQNENYRYMAQITDDERFKTKAEQVEQYKLMGKDEEVIDYKIKSVKNETDKKIKVIADITYTDSTNKSGSTTEETPIYLKQQKGAGWKVIVEDEAKADLAALQEAEKKETPEQFAVKYLDLIKVKDFDKVAVYTLDDHYNGDAGLTAKRYKETAKEKPTITGYQIQSVKNATYEKATVAIVVNYDDGSDIVTELQLKRLGTMWVNHVKNKSGSM
ncbi:hypothetical protein [Bacillus sp. 1P06AnD]|uniref:hypothetical protein n=1 Tax=Bacillus sp. 1P06AnD TaxID=3132208 RepID=UPI00399F1D46